ncbi:hypothetical protein MAR_011294 [Mya arenaria]|uniref:Uncharacterized protein n=1 Tax=Mya arenaria TaxID=6604 RepID=A0ABY7FUE6_MYAAR|nr:hypothetical protein MAR_011294 [Mya arenaria]
MQSLLSNTSISDNCASVLDQLLGFSKDQVAGVLLCNGSTPCPAHKPYCTNAGCVFQCPLDSYVNGDHCVRDCAKR